MDTPSGPLNLDLDLFETSADAKTHVAGIQSFIQAVMRSFPRNRERQGLANRAGRLGGEGLMGEAAAARKRKWK